MKSHSKKILFSPSRSKKAFSLIEAGVALIILAFICTSVLVIINRSMISAANSAMRMHAFEIARENMENLLTKKSLTQMVEYGNSERFSEIQWQTTVETFIEPITSQTWLQAVCISEYPDVTGETQRIELTHWITKLTKQQALQASLQKERERQWLIEQGLAEQGLTEQEIIDQGLGEKTPEQGQGETPSQEEIDKANAEWQKMLEKLKGKK